MSLSTLESRLKDSIPPRFHESVEKEFSKYEMETSRLSKETDRIGQATLTQSEIQRAVTTNQYGDYGHTIIELQGMKGVAMHYDIDGWLDYIDPKLTYEENIQILEDETNPTMKEGKKQWM